MFYFLNEGLSMKEVYTYAAKTKLPSVLDSKYMKHNGKHKNIIEGNSTHRRNTHVK